MLIYLQGVRGITSGGKCYRLLPDKENTGPLSANSDQHEFSPDNIHVLPREMVRRNTKMITKTKCFDLLSHCLN